MTLYEHDKTEWRDAARRLAPDMTDEEFNRAWAEFQAAKAEQLKQRSMQ